MKSSRKSSPNLLLCKALLSWLVKAIFLYWNISPKHKPLRMLNYLLNSKRTLTTSKSYGVSEMLIRMISSIFNHQKPFHKVRNRNRISLNRKWQGNSSRVSWRKINTIKKWIYHGKMKNMSLSTENKPTKNLIKFLKNKWINYSNDNFTNRTKATNNNSIIRKNPFQQTKKTNNS